MPYSDKTYIPPTFDELLQIVFEKWNTEFKTNFDVQTFKGTNAYRFAYVFIQTQIEQQAAVAEIYEKLQVYFESINAYISDPTTTNNGIIDAFKENGYVASVRDNTQTQAGRLAVAVDVDTTAEDYEDKKQEILTIIKDNSVGGLFYDGSESGDLQLSNGQVMPFRFSPSSKFATSITITITYARGSKYARLTDDQVKEKLLFNLAALYGQGQDFAPAKYYEINRDAPYAANIDLLYSNSKTGGSLVSTIYKSTYTDLFTFSADSITVIQNEQ